MHCPKRGYLSVRLAWKSIENGILQNEDGFFKETVLLYLKTSDEKTGKYCGMKWVKDYANCHWAM